MITIKKINKLIRENYWFVAILILAVVFRLFRYQEHFIYNHDQDLIGWFIKDVVFNKHLRLVGQETSTEGIFIGPLFYYFLVPFYLLAKFDPLGGFWGVFLLGLITLLSFYFVFSNIFKKRVGIIASLIYAVSAYTVFNDRWMVPTMTVFLWTTWYFYSLYLIYHSQKKGFVLAGILLGLIWHISVALVVLTPILFYSYLVSRVKKLENWGYFGISFLVALLPLIIFEVRHQFLQVRLFVEALVTNQQDVISGVDKLVKVLNTVSQTAQMIALSDGFLLNRYLLLLLLAVLLFFLIRKKLLPKPWPMVIALWFALYLSFFSLYSKILSEYYLDGLVVIYILLISLFLSYVLKKWRLIFCFIIIAFLTLQTRGLILKHVNRSYYQDRLILVDFIKADSREHDYPCVSISYITDPGYDLGYRYLFWYRGVKIAVPGKAPVYSIVFPHSRVDSLDKYFGALGLVLPEYQNYESEDVEEICSGSDYNLTVPMWGLPN